MLSNKVLNLHFHPQRFQNVLIKFFGPNTRGSLWLFHLWKCLHWPSHHTMWSQLLQELPDWSLGQGWALLLSSVQQKVHGPAGDLHQCNSQPDFSPDKEEKGLNQQEVHRTWWGAVWRVCWSEVEGHKVVPGVFDLVLWRPPGAPPESSLSDAAQTDGASSGAGEEGLWEAPAAAGAVLQRRSGVCLPAVQWRWTSISPDGSCGARRSSAEGESLTVRTSSAPRTTHLIAQSFFYCCLICCF